jgi:flavin reductase (DIM6/NTAB) family NADH-FMN oxidoreductase RutF
VNSIERMEQTVELRSLLRRLPHGVAVVTVDADGQRLGLTVDSLVSLSLEPPLVGVAVSRQAAMHELLRDAGSFAVSLLGERQASVAQHFARGVPPIALWHGIELRDGGGAPLIAGALGWLGCRVIEEVETGDHTLFVGEVLSVEPGASSAPLVHYQSEYRSL